MDELPNRDSLLQFDSPTTIDGFLLKNPGDATGPLKPLGQGGSGVVYLAQQTLSENAIIERAFKFFVYRDDVAALTAHASSGAVGESAFLDEIVNLSKINHENILKVIAAGRWRHAVSGLQIPYLVTDLMSSSTLLSTINSDEYRQFADDKDEVIFDWMSQLCRGLAHLHSRGFFHCDIAPKNVFVQGQMPDCTLVIGDLGAAKKTESLPDKVLVIGTRAYMSPESQVYFNKTATRDVFLSLQPKWDYHSLCQTCIDLLNPLTDIGSRRRWLTPLRGILQDEQRNSSHCSVLRLQERIEWLRPSLRTTVSIPELTESYRGNKQVLMPVESAITSKRIRSLIHHPAVLRLKKVYQISMGPAVFPGATHSRYEHAIGTYQMMRRYLTALLDDNDFLQAFGPDYGELALLAALLCNVSTYPFGPVLREVQSADNTAFLRFTRSNMWAAVSQKEYLDDGPPLADVIKKEFSRVDYSALESILHDEASYPSSAVRFIHFLLSSSIDCRVLDYLRRDSVHIGLSAGDAFDVKELLSHIKYNDGSVAIKSSGLPVVEQIVTFRYGMYNRIYWNSPHRCLHAMLSYVLLQMRMHDEHFETDLFNSCLMMSDSEILDFVHNRAGNKASVDVVELCDMLKRPRPRLYDEVFQFNRAEDDARIAVICDRLAKLTATELLSLQERLEEYLGERFEMPSERANVLIDYPREVGYMKLGEDINVLTHRKEVVQLRRLSKIVDGAMDGFVQHLQRVRVYLHPNTWNAIRDREDAVKQGIREFFYTQF